MTPMLIASSPTLEGIQECIKKYFYASEVKLELIAENTYSVATGKGIIPNMRVFKKGRRFRFESL